MSIPLEEITKNYNGWGKWVTVTPIIVESREGEKKQVEVIAEKSLTLLKRAPITEIGSLTVEAFRDQNCPNATHYYRSSILESTPYVDFYERVSQKANVHGHTND